ncbi:hypothetical protein [Variovorax ginsengisoli]|uniref:Uncharacterized protein n=1 Tax=Variovorax ginsengisoli TaxID=363844 RepID=A0ABT8S7G2_9BURK|nr:hypothetical protein [Variovorax ginsengisoli]MDN8615683.1 hypothetical protein [Variovorax ginsengisoli]MDO1534853.1 hypothetical protein [Variovorax ginsengisoli]
MDSIPEDFPLPVIGAVPGVQPKILVRLIDGRYINDAVTDEAQERYQLCADLVVQLASYAQRKRAEHPDWSRAELQAKLASGLQRKNWGLSNAEIQWISGRACALPE